MAANLRVYPATEDAPLPEKQDATIPVCLGELLPILTQAYRYNYTWLQDFLEDEVQVTPDLFEVLRSFRCYRPSA